MPKAELTTITDYHVHTPYCGHAQGKIPTYVEAAVKAGLGEIGFADHLGRYYLTKSQKRRYWDWGMHEHNIGRYMSDVADAADSLDGQITVRCGLEVDYIEGAEDLLNSIIDNYPVDYLLGSIHCIPSLGWKHIAHYQRKDTWTIYQRYFEQAQAAVESGLFDSLAHLDFIWRYVKWPESNAEKVFESIDTIIATAKRNNIAIEINANAFLWSQLYQVEGGDPFEVLLKSIQNHDTVVTIGSDAHKPEFVAKAFDGLLPLVKKAGITKLAVFDNRNRAVVSLP